jgi:serine/threonine protein kinase
MIPSRPPPTFKDMSRWTPALNDFVSKCLVKNPDARSTATELLNVIIHIFNSSIIYFFKLA